MAASMLYLSGVLSKNSAGMPEANVSIDWKAAQLVGSQTRLRDLIFNVTFSETFRKR